MRADPRFAAQPPHFWANVRSVSQAVGYTDRRSGAMRVPTVADVSKAYGRLGLATDHLFDSSGVVTPMGQDLFDYFSYRARLLTDVVEPNLMDLDDAREQFEQTRAALSPRRPFVRNKQKGDKAGPALLTGIVNMILESKVGDDCDFDPQQLTTVTRDGKPLRTLARRVDGAYPSTVNPVAIWEIKEYYHTTTFGSRVADGVYETLLDGMELAELVTEEGIRIRHYLVIDSHFTWWMKGRSYLCRIVDMLHMGYVEEVLVGREVLTRLPELVDEWISARAGAQDTPPEPPRPAESVGVSDMAER